MSIEEFKQDVYKKIEEVEYKQYSRFINQNSTYFFYTIKPDKYEQIYTFIEEKFNVNRETIDMLYPKFSIKPSVFHILPLVKMIYSIITDITEHTFTQFMEDFIKTREVFTDKEANAFVNSYIPLQLMKVKRMITTIFDDKDIQEKHKKEHIISRVDLVKQYAIKLRSSESVKSYISADLCRDFINIFITDFTNYDEILFDKPKIREEIKHLEDLIRQQDTLRQGKLKRQEALKRQEDVKLIENLNKVIMLTVIECVDVNFITNIYLKHGINENITITEEKYNRFAKYVVYLQHYLNSILTDTPLNTLMTMEEIEDISLFLGITEFYTLYKLKVKPKTRIDSKQELKDKKSIIQEYTDKFTQYTRHIKRKIKTIKEEDLVGEIKRYDANLKYVLKEIYKLLGIFGINKNIFKLYIEKQLVTSISMEQRNVLYCQNVEEKDLPAAIPSYIGDALKYTFIHFYDKKLGEDDIVNISTEDLHGLYKLINMKLIANLPDILLEETIEFKSVTDYYVMNRFFTEYFDDTDRKTLTYKYTKKTTDIVELYDSDNTVYKTKLEEYKNLTTLENKLYSSIYNIRLENYFADSKYIVQYATLEYSMKKQTEEQKQFKDIIDNYTNRYITSIVSDYVLPDKEQLSLKLELKNFDTDSVKNSIIKKYKQILQEIAKLIDDILSRQYSISDNINNVLDDYQIPLSINIYGLKRNRTLGLHLIHKTLYYGVDNKLFTHENFTQKIHTIRPSDVYTNKSKEFLRILEVEEKQKFAYVVGVVYKHNYHNGLDDVQICCSGTVKFGKTKYFVEPSVITAQRELYEETSMYFDTDNIHKLGYFKDGSKDVDVYYVRIENRTEPPNNLDFKSDQRFEENKGSTKSYTKEYSDTRDRKILCLIIGNDVTKFINVKKTSRNHKISDNIPVIMCIPTNNRYFI